MASTPPNCSLPSHKRTSSALEITIEAPKPKRQNSQVLAPAWSSPPPSRSPQYQHIYIVMVESEPPYSPPSTDIEGVYSSLEDANNAVRRLANDFVDPEGCENGTKYDGTIYWAAEDVGNGESARVFAKLWEVRGPGSEKPCDWENAGEMDDELACDEVPFDERDFAEGK